MTESIQVNTLCNANADLKTLQTPGFVAVVGRLLGTGQVAPFQVRLRHQPRRRLRLEVKERLHAPFHARPLRLLPRLRVLLSSVRSLHPKPLHVCRNVRLRSSFRWGNCFPSQCTLPSQYHKVADAVPNSRADEDVGGKVRLVGQPGEREECGSP